MTTKTRRWQYKARGGMLFADGEITADNALDATQELLTELRERLQPPYTVDMLTNIEISEAKED